MFRRLSQRTATDYLGITWRLFCFVSFTFLRSGVSLSNRANFGVDMNYLRGFVQVQDMVDRAIVSLLAGFDVVDPRVSLKRMPWPCRTED